MKWKSVKDYDLEGKTVLLRADLNVPVQNGKVTDTTRIDRLKPTIDYLREQKAKVLIISHFGRPEGEQNPEMSLAFLSPVLQERWDLDVIFCQDCIGRQTAQIVKQAPCDAVLLLENVRFHKGEEANDKGFALELAALADLYVNDAFSAAHRAHASTEAVARLLPSAAGLLMNQELNALEKALGSPVKPVAAITGGSKISTKLSVLGHLVEKVDYLILGGGMANTFLLAAGAEIGNSLCEENMTEQAQAIIAKAKASGCEIILPSDCVVAQKLQPGITTKAVKSSAIPEGYMALDIGPDTIRDVETILRKTSTVLWNGPMGVFEIKPFDKGTNALAKTVAALTQKGQVTSVAGGGDTIAALENAGAKDSFSYVSTAGGAFLEWMEGKTLPGVAALDLRNQKAA